MIRELILCWRWALSREFVLCVIVKLTFKISLAYCVSYSYTEGFGSDWNVLLSNGPIVCTYLPECVGKLFLSVLDCIFFLSMKSWLKWRKEGPVRFGVWLNLQPGSVSGVSFCFGMDVWCLFSMFCMVLWKQWVWPRNRSLCSSLFCRYTWLDAVFLSFTQPKTSANISTDTEWQSDMAHWYACEEALAKLMVSSAKAGSCGWWKQVGVKVLAWRKDRGNQWKHNSTEAETNNMFQVSFISAELWVFYYEACGGLQIMFGENETVLTWY